MMDFEDQLDRMLHRALHPSPWPRGVDYTYGPFKQFSKNEKPTAQRRQRTARRITRQNRK